MKEEEATAGRRSVVGGVDTHKDLHVVAVVDEHDRVLGNECFPTSRQGYKQMLLWMRSFGELARVGVECTGSYGAGLLRYLQQAHVTVLEVTTPDKSDRRKRGKDDTLDAQNAAHAAFAGIRTVRGKTISRSECGSGRPERFTAPELPQKAVVVNHRPAGNSWYLYSYCPNGVSRFRHRPGAARKAPVQVHPERSPWSSRC